MTPSKKAVSRGKLRVIPRIAIWGLIALALYHFAAAVTQHWSSITDWNPSWVSWTVLLVTITLYGANLFLLAEVWHLLVHNCKGESFTRSVTYPSYSKTQIAKYLPGNVFQFIGRHIMMTRQGASQRWLALASLTEITIMLAAASTLVILGSAFGFLPQLATLFENIKVGWIAFGCIPLMLLGGVLAAMKLRALSPFLPARVLFRGFALAMLFFLVLGLILLILVRTVSSGGGAEVMIIAILSWLIGYVTPGAPGGIGIREFVMLFLLQAHMADAEALIAIGLFRLATSFGDFAFFTAGEILWRTQSNERTLTQDRKDIRRDQLKPEEQGKTNVRTRIKH